MGCHSSKSTSTLDVAVVPSVSSKVGEAPSSAVAAIVSAAFAAATAPHGSTDTINDVATADGNNPAGPVVDKRPRPADTNHEASRSVSSSSSESDTDSDDDRHANEDGESIDGESDSEWMMDRHRWADVESEAKTIIVTASNSNSRRPVKSILAVRMFRDVSSGELSFVSPRSYSSTRPLTPNRRGEKKQLRFDVAEGLEWIARAPLASITTTPQTTFEDDATKTYVRSAIRAMQQAGERWHPHHAHPRPRSQSVTDAAVTGSRRRGKPSALALQLPQNDAPILTPAALSLSIDSLRMTSTSMVDTLQSPASSGRAASPGRSPSPSPSPRQYTSSARVAGSSSFRNRMTRAREDRDIHSLSLQISFACNPFLRLSPHQIINLSCVSLQQLFLLYSRAARSSRDKLLASSTATGSAKANRRRQRQHSAPPVVSPRAGGKHADSDSDSDSDSRSTGDHDGSRSIRISPALSSPSLEQCFLLSAGIVASSMHPPPTSALVTASQQFIELASSCTQAPEEMRVLCQHLVTKKLELFVTAVNKCVNKDKTSSTLLTAQFDLFYGAANAITTSAAASTTITRMASEATQTNSSSLSSMRISSSRSMTASPSAAAATTTAMHAAMERLSDAQADDIFVQCTIDLMHSRIGANNFGEISWHGMLDRWASFAGFFFHYHAIRNPNGSDVVTDDATMSMANKKATMGRQQGAQSKHASGCVVM